MSIPRTVTIFACLMALTASARADDYVPDYKRIRAGLERRTAPPVPTAAVEARGSSDRPQVARVVRPRDSVWNGVLIGAAIGAGGGYLWARNICSPKDEECFAITSRAGVLGGAAIGALVGGILDALQR
jgi:hypothetical protein